MIEVNFDGLVGPSHNYAGLSLGNLAATGSAGADSHPRAAALEGLAKMRAMMALGLAQGFLPPPERPATGWLRSLGFAGSDDAVCAAAYAADPTLLACALSASAMWTANAATVSPAPDTADGRCHLTVANLSTMAHRSIEAPQTLAHLETIFPDRRRFALHPPVPARFGDEGAANHMRMAIDHATQGLEIFVYGAPDGVFPARQDRRASEAVARLHGLASERAVFVQQSPEAIAAGAFHNDVVAVANERMLFAHEQAFADKAAFYDSIERAVYDAVILEVPASRVSLEEAVRCYLFNSQLLTLPDGGMTLVVPGETRASPAAWSWLRDLAAGNGPVPRIEVVDVRESMRNGGGPACLRLRVAVDEAALAGIDPRFLLDAAKWEALRRLVETHWPDRIAADDLGNPALWGDLRAANAALRAHLKLS